MISRVHPVKTHSGISFIAHFFSDKMKHVVRMSNEKSVLWRELSYCPALKWVASPDKLRVKIVHYTPYTKKDKTRIIFLIFFFSPFGEGLCLSIELVPWKLQTRRVLTDVKVLVNYTRWLLRLIINISLYN